MAKFNYNLSSELWEDIFINKNINMMLNSFLNTFLRFYFMTPFKGYIKLEGARRLQDGKHPPVVT